MTTKCTSAKVYLTKLDFCELLTLKAKNKYENALNTIPQFRKEKILQYIKQEDKYRSFYAWKLLETAMRIEFCLDIKKEIFKFTPYGKAYLDKSNVHFNLSHSGEIVVCAVDIFPIGIDVEGISPIDLSIAFSFFSEKECFDLFGLLESEQVSYFYKLWTLKESYIKAEGEGLSIPLNSFTFNVGHEAIRFEGRNEHKWNFFLQNIKTDNKDYYLGFCSHKGRKTHEIFEMPYASFL